MGDSREVRIAQGGIDPIYSRKRVIAEIFPDRISGVNRLGAFPKLKPIDQGIPGNNSIPRFFLQY
jgi:hypothetical protein